MTSENKVALKIAPKGAVKIHESEGSNSVAM